MESRTRVPDWSAALVRWARSCVGRPYVWGETDCGTLGREALRVLFGSDVLPGVSGWSTTRDAVHTAANLGTPSAVLTALGAEVQSAMFARAGDLVIVPEPAVPGGEAVCVVIDGKLALHSTHDCGVVLDPIPTDGMAYSLWTVRADG